MISDRAKKAFKPALSYIELFQEALSDVYHPEDNKEGYLCFTVAENKVSFENLLASKLVSISKSNTLADFDEHNFSPFYGDFTGNIHFKRALAAFFDKYFLRQNLSIDYKFSPDGFLFASGCSSLLESLSWILGNERDSIIIPAPYYPAFDNDLTIRSSLTIAQAYLNGPDFKLTENVLEDTLLNCKTEPKVLWLTNPGNPLGTCYSKQELEMALKFARKHKLFLISDEIYACSVYGEDKFISMAEICLEQSENGQIGDDVIIMYGFSKDFCLSGSRVGLIYTENKDILQVYAKNYSLFAAVSSFTQMQLTKLLQDTSFVSEYLEKSREIIRLQAEQLKRVLDNVGIPFINPTASLFLVADFLEVIMERYQLSADKVTFEVERKFFEEIAAEQKIVMTPGKDCNFNRAGYFRICFMFSNDTSITEFGVRLKKFLRME